MSRKIWQWFILLILLMGNTIEGATVKSNVTDDVVRHFESGVLFLKIGSLYNVNTRVIVPIEFRSKHIIDGFNQIVNSIEKVKLEVKVQNKTEHLDFISDLETLKNGVENTFKQVLEFFNGIRITRASRRYTRGAVDIIGDLGNILFGLATEDQVNEVTKALSNVDRLSEENLRRLNIINTVMRVEDTRFKRLKQAQIKMHNAVAKLFDNLKSVAVKINILDQKIQFEHILNTLSVSYLDLELNIKEIIKGVSNMMSGKLDDRIVSKRLLLHILGDIKRAGHALMLPDDIYQLKYYNKIIRVGNTYDRQLDSLMFYLSIPTYASVPMPKFRLMRVETFPTPIQNTSNTIMKYQDLPNYFATSKYYYLEMESLNDCIQVNDMYFCELSKPINNYDSSTRCAASLYKNDKIKKHCKVNFGKDAQNKFLKVQNLVFYFVNNTIDIEIVCDKNSNSNWGIPNIKLMGLGYVAIASNCQGIGPGIILPASMATFAEGYKLEQFHSPLNFSMSLSTNSSFLTLKDEQINKLDNITKNIEEEVPMAKLLAILDSNNDVDNYSSSSAKEMYGQLTLHTMVFLVIILAVMVYLTKYHKQVQRYEVDPPEPAQITYRRRSTNGSRTPHNTPPPPYRRKLEEPVEMEFPTVINHIYDIAEEDPYMRMDMGPQRDENYNECII